MKITEKIVTSITQPQQTNVLWHNPETGELKMFGNKGWEVVGGNPGENDSSNTNTNGYPIVTVADDFNITAEPNTFYNIKNNVDDTININFNVNELYATGKDGLIFFTCENFHDEEFPDILDVMYIANGFGIRLIADNSLQGFKYKSILSKDLVSALGMQVDKDIVIYYSDYLQNGKDITIFTEGQEPIILKNVHILNKDPYLCYISASAMGLPFDCKVPVLIIEDLTNHPDASSHLPDGYNHAYFAICIMREFPLFTKKPYQEDNHGLIITGSTSDDVMIINYEVVANMNIECSNSMKEFVFNVNSPTNIIFNNSIKWNNDNTPDLTIKGVYTISILNGVGCYTFVNE